MLSLSYAATPNSYETAERFTDDKLSALSRLQTPFYSPLWGAMIGSQLYHTWPTAIIIRYSFCSFPQLSPHHLQDATYHFHTQNNTAYAEYIHFCESSCCVVISAVTVWISMWLSLNKIGHKFLSRLDKLILAMVYTEPSNKKASKQCVNSETLPTYCGRRTRHIQDTV